MKKNIERFTVYYNHDMQKWGQTRPMGQGQLGLARILGRGGG